MSLPDVIHTVQYIDFLNNIIYKIIKKQNCDMTRSTLLVSWYVL